MSVLFALFRYSMYANFFHKIVFFQFVNCFLMIFIANIYCRFYEASVPYKIKLEIIEICTIHVKLHWSIGV